MMPRRRPETSRQEHAGLYIRVSLDRTARGMQEEMMSPDTQQDRARSYCQAQAWTVAAVEQDIDESAYRQHYSQRPGLMRLLQLAESGQVTKIVVWKFSRLSRRLKEFIEICDRVEAAGGGVVSVTEQVDTSTPAGRLIRNILASFAQFQSEEISEQIFETWVTKARRGERPPGFVPFGVRNNRGILEPDPEQHQHLIAMYRTFRDTRSLKAVWDYLTEHQVPAPRASEWSLNTIRGILSNPVYIGRIEWAGEVYEGRWEPIVPADLWQEVHDLFDSRRTQPPERRDARMLSGIMRCGNCGRRMWTRYGKRSDGGQAQMARLYWCVLPFNGRKGCDVPTVYAEEAEAAVWQMVLTILSHTALDELIAAAALQQEGRAPDDGARRRQQLAAERERIERSATQLFDLLADSSITREQFRQQNARYIDRLRGIQEELARLPVMTGGPDTEGMRQAAQRARAAVTDQERREVLADLGAEVIVSQRRVYLQLLGLRLNLRARRLGDTWHFGAAYQRLDYQGALLTDKQLEFMRRTYAWGDKREIAARLGRQYGSLVTRARALGLAPAGRGRWRRH